MNYITGNKLKKIANYIFDFDGFYKTDNEIYNNIEIYWIKTDFIDNFFENYKPNRPYKIITHNSDYSINETHLKYLDDLNLIKWYGININTIHEKLISIPIGIANEIWEYGNEELLNKINSTNINKDNLFYCNFNKNTNLIEREKCLDIINRNNIKNYFYCDIDSYLEVLKKSYFNICPNGNGIDTHRFWESLYFKTIPIVTKSINVEFYKDYPIVIIDNWSDFNYQYFTIEMYNDLILKYSEEKLNVDYIYNKIKN